MAQTISIESWDPAFGVSADIAENVAATVDIDPGIEIPAERWKPLAPARPTPVPRRVAFVDGVQRIDANAWLRSGTGPVRRGVLASIAAGVSLSEGAHVAVECIEVRRRLIAPGNPETVTTRFRDDPYTPVGTVGGDTAALAVALQDELGRLELEVASRAGQADLLVVDGQLYGRQHLPFTVGYIKSHVRHYLAPALLDVVETLEPGERSPVFRFTTSWTRNSWYLRLPGPRAHPWSCVVRLEAPAAASLEQTRALADAAALVLGRFASKPHKEPRAPQNLYPIAGLERLLRHRLGDPAVLERALLEAAGQKLYVR